MAHSAAVWVLSVDKSVWRQQVIELSEEDGILRVNKPQDWKTTQRHARDDAPVWGQLSLLDVSVQQMESELPQHCDEWRSHGLCLRFKSSVAWRWYAEARSSIRPGVAVKSLLLSFRSNDERDAWARALELPTSRTAERAQPLGSALSALRAFSPEKPTQKTDNLVVASPSDVTPSPSRQRQAVTATSPVLTASRQQQEEVWQQEQTSATATNPNTIHGHVSNISPGGKTYATTSADEHADAAVMVWKNRRQQCDSALERGLAMHSRRIRDEYVSSNVVSVERLSLSPDATVSPRQQQQQQQQQQQPHDVSDLVSHNGNPSINGVSDNRSFTFNSGGRGDSRGSRGSGVTLGKISSLKMKLDASSEQPDSLVCDFVGASLSGTVPGTHRIAENNVARDHSTEQRSLFGADISSLASGASKSSALTTATPMHLHRSMSPQSTPPVLPDTQGRRLPSGQQNVPTPARVSPLRLSAATADVLPPEARAELERFRMRTAEDMRKLLHREAESRDARNALSQIVEKQSEEILYLRSLVAGTADGVTTGHDQGYEPLLSPQATSAMPIAKPANIDSTPEMAALWQQFEFTLAINRDLKRRLQHYEQNTPSRPQQPSSGLGEDAGERPQVNAARELRM